MLGLTISKKSRLEKKEWILLPIVESVFRPLNLYLKEYGIIKDDDFIKIPNTLRTPKMYQSELVAVLYNLISNAIKAVKGKKERKIEVRGFEEEEIHIWFLDSGKGIDKNLREKVFEPFESFSEPDLRLGIGTGLGLKIVRDIARSYGGEAKFIDPPGNWKTCVEIILSKKGTNEN